MTAGIATAAAAQDNAQIERGMKVYGDQKCAVGHSIAGKGNVKGPLDGVGSRLSLEELRLWMVDPAGMTREPAAGHKETAWHSDPASTSSRPASGTSSGRSG
jgi:hypothetical protein